METAYSRITHLLDSHDIIYQTFEHAPVVTSTDAAAIRGTDLAKGAKSLVFIADDKPILLVLSGDKKVDTKKIKAELDIKDLRMASHEEVENLTGCPVGGVPPIGSVLGLPTYLDQAFTRNETMDFNAGERERSIEMKVEDFVRIVSPQVFPFS